MNMITVSFRTSVSHLPADALARLVFRRRRSRSSSCRYKLPLPFMRVYVTSRRNIASRPNGTDKRINAKRFEIPAACRYISRRRSVNLDRRTREVNGKEGERGRGREDSRGKLSRSRRLITRRISSESVCARGLSAALFASIAARGLSIISLLFSFLFFPCFQKQPDDYPDKNRRSPSCTHSSRSLPVFLLSLETSLEFC